MTVGVVVDVSVEPVVRMIDVIGVVLVVVLAKGAMMVLLAKGATSKAVEAVAKSPAAKKAAEVKEGIVDQAVRSSFAFEREDTPSPGRLEDRANVDDTKIVTIGRKLVFATRRLPHRTLAQHDNTQL